MGESFSLNITNSIKEYDIDSNKFFKSIPKDQMIHPIKKTNKVKCIKILSL